MMEYSVIADKTGYEITLSSDIPRKVLFLKCKPVAKVIEGFTFETTACVGTNEAIVFRGNFAYRLTDFLNYFANFSFVEYLSITRHSQLDYLEASWEIKRIFTNLCEHYVLFYQNKGCRLSPPKIKKICQSFINGVTEENYELAELSVCELMVYILKLESKNKWRLY